MEKAISHQFSEKPKTSYYMISASLPKLYIYLEVSTLFTCSRPSTCLLHPNLLHPNHAQAATITSGNHMSTLPSPRRDHGESNLKTGHWVPVKEPPPWPELIWLTPHFHWGLPRMSAGAAALCHIRNPAWVNHPPSWFFIPLLCTWYPAVPAVPPR